MFFRRMTIGLLLSTGVVLLGGCGSSGPDLADVKGQVTINGKPVGSLMVEFAPADGKIGAARAFTDADGNFRLKYNRKKAGAMVGMNQVSFISMSYAPPTIPVPKKYADGNSDLTAEVTHKGPNEFVFDLTDK